jgi:hypothetical protein
MDKHGVLTPQYDALIRLLAESAAIKWLNNQQATQERDAGNVQNMPVREIQH